MGTVTAGTMTTQSVYAWQTSPSNEALTYTSLTETWAEILNSAVTNYLVNANGSPRTTTVTMPNGMEERPVFTQRSGSVQRRTDLQGRNL